MDPSSGQMVEDLVEVGEATIEVDVGDMVEAMITADPSSSPVELAQELGVDVARVYRRASCIGLAWDGARWWPKSQVAQPVTLVDPAGDGNYKDARDCNRDELLALIERYGGKGEADEAA